MGRIFYGLMGDARGHLARAEILARELDRHEILFFGGGLAAHLKESGHRVEQAPMVETVLRGDRVDLGATAWSGARVLARAGSGIKLAAGLIERFDPDLIISDYELFTPLAAHRLNRRAVSLDHQHILTNCSGQPGLGGSRFLTTGLIRLLFSRADHFLITSFFRLPVRDPDRTELFPPLLSPDLSGLKPSDGGHILVYLRPGGEDPILGLVADRPGGPHPVYGRGRGPGQPGLAFKAPSRQGFLEDLATCRYVITGGGHNLLSEARWLGKPVLARPPRHFYEQHLNAYFVERQGWGSYLPPGDDPEAALDRFEARLGGYREVLRDRPGWSNRPLVERLEELIGLGFSR